MEQEYIIENVEVGQSYQYKGSELQDYSVALQGETGWIKLTQKPTTPPPAVGRTLYGHIENKTTSNGNPYRKFVKARDFGSPSPTREAPRDDSKLDYVIQMLEEMTGRKEVKDNKKEPHNDPFEGLV